MRRSLVYATFYHFSKAIGYGLGLGFVAFAIMRFAFPYDPFSELVSAPGKNFTQAMAGDFSRVQAVFLDSLLETVVILPIYPLLLLASVGVIAVGRTTRSARVTQAGVVLGAVGFAIGLGLILLVFYPFLELIFL